MYAPRLLAAVAAALIGACSGEDASPAGAPTDAGADSTSSPPDTAVIDSNTKEEGTAETAPPDACTDASPTVSPSCAGGLSCGCVSCCDAKPIPAGTFPMGRSESGTDACPSWGSGCLAIAELPEHPATVSSFRLDTFEVTVGRFRKFVAGYPANKPAAGAGAHPTVAGSGWNASWPLPTDASALVAALNCEAGATWTDAAGANENKPITCIDWYTAFAFCAWDGGRLPTSAEWEYAAAGGSENRLLPWVGTAKPDCAHANYFECGKVAMDVGSLPLGMSRWGQLDLAGNAKEHVLDEYANYTSDACNDCANVTFASDREHRGGGFNGTVTSMRVASRAWQKPTSRYADVGFRCARSP